MELCAAVLGIEVSDIIKEQLGVPSECFRFYTDSQIVLGYLTNTTSRFYVYVSNRVNRIHLSSPPNQWTHVPTEQNPADQATRSVSALHLANSLWLTGPSCDILTRTLPEPQLRFPLVEPNSDCEIRPEVTCSKIQIDDETPTNHRIGSERFLRFSTWESLVRGVKLLKLSVCKRIKHSDIDSVTVYELAKLFVIQTVQREAYSEAFKCIECGQSLPNGHSLVALSPYVDQHGVLRVGGRLDKKKLGGRDGCHHPVIMPKNHYATKLLVRRFHHQVLHQGRLLTEGAIRTGGFWVVGAKNLVRSRIRPCITCRKLRGSFGWQKMADLPEDRPACPTLLLCWCYTFGPWITTQRQTRGGTVNQKRWALMFTCLVSCAVHLEAIEELSTSSFINELRRFTALRGQVIQFRSDRGTNFIGAVHELNIPSDLIEDPLSQKCVKENKITLMFNPPLPLTLVEYGKNDMCLKEDFGQLTHEPQRTSNT